MAMLNTPHQMKREQLYISGMTFGPKKVEFSIIDGLAVFEGDIILGKVEELRESINY